MPDGSLESEQELDLGGENPRQIVLCRNHLYVICMDSQNILKIELDAEGRPGQIYPVVHQVEDIACAKFIQEGETNG